MTATATQTWSPETAASAAQANYILSLQGMPKDDDNYAEAALAITEMMTKKEASALIDSLKTAFTGNVVTGAAKAQAMLAKVAKPVMVPAVAKGEWHCYDGKFFLVAQSQNTGNLYAKARNMEAGAGFDYAPGIMKFLNTTTKVNAHNIDGIRAYADLHHKCIFCNLPLDQPESRVAGYGEKCASNQGLPWGE